MAKKTSVKLLGSVAGYSLAAQDYDKRENYLNSFEQGKLLPLLGDVTGKKVLDVGAGTGRIAVQLSKLGAAVTALDISEEMLKVLAKKDTHILTVLHDAEDLPFDKDTFDSVVANFLVVHLKNPERFLDEVYRVLKPGGLLVVTNINQKDPPVVKTRAGEIIIESYYHRPEKIRLLLESLAFGIEEEIFVKEGELWTNQIIAARK